MLRLLTDTAVSHKTFAQREFVQLHFFFFFFFLLHHAKGFRFAFQTPQDMNIAFSSTPNTDIIYEGNHHQPRSEPCLPLPSSWPPTVLFVSKTEAFCGLIQQGFNQHISMYFYLCYKVSIYATAPRMVFNDLQDVHFPIISWLCYYVTFLPSAVWWRSHLFLHPQTVSVSSLCVWWGCQRDSVWPSDEMRQGQWLASVSLTCSRWQSQDVCVWLMWV